MRRYSLLLGLVGFFSTAVLACGDGEEGTVTATGGTGGGAGGLTGTGGVAGEGTGGAAPGCSAVSILTPADGSQLGDAADADRDCENGIQVDVRVATDAPDGAEGVLTADGTQLATGSVSAAAVLFEQVQLASTGTVELQVEIGGESACTATATVTTQCEGAPSCTITAPQLSDAHPELNNVPVSEGGDRVSAEESPYRAAFQVLTSAEEGQLVTLEVDGVANAAAAEVVEAVAIFAGVTLEPDGTHTVVATCRSASGKLGTSAAGDYAVDTQPPDLIAVEPHAGQFFGPGDDVDPGTDGVQFRVCGTTTAADAVDLSASLEAGADNLCVGSATSTPECVAAVTDGVGSEDGGCVIIDCPGGAPFDLVVTLRDDAGNSEEQTVGWVACASDLPGVQIVEPVDGTGADVSTHILAASMSQARIDQDPATPGAQYTVVGCTDAAPGSAQLYAGLQGQQLEPIGGPVTTEAATGDDNCPAGLSQVARFVDVTLPESLEDTAGALVTPTQLRVEVTDDSTALGQSPVVDVWVDSVPPSISVWHPSTLCGSLYRSTVAVTEDVWLASSVVPVTAGISNEGGPPDVYTGSTIDPSGTQLLPTPVAFGLGENVMTASGVEPAGNEATMEPCTVTVGTPPLVTWVAPTLASALSASTDGDPGTPGWQGVLSVQTDIGGSGLTVDFSTAQDGAVASGVPIDGAGVATTPTAVTIADGNAVSLTATTAAHPTRGVGTATLYPLVVDTVKPDDVTDLSVEVFDRRATTFQLAWTAPDDGGQNADSYQVRASRTPITDLASFDAAEPVPYLESPLSAGTPDEIRVASRLIETDYYFAVVAVDRANNRSENLATVGPVRAEFNQAIISPGNADEEFGKSFDGSTSINGDGYSDLMVGTAAGHAVYVYFGSSSGLSATPDVTISGAVGSHFGFSVAVVGDIDGDGLEDIAIGAYLDLGSGVVYVFRGRTSWPSVLSSFDADYVILPDPVQETKLTAAAFGLALARLGDFDGDRADDFAIGAPYYDNYHGAVVVVRGTNAWETFPSTVKLPADYGTRAIAIEGDSTLDSAFFGLSLVGLGRYYPLAGNALVVSAPGDAANRVYLFRGRLASAGSISISTADGVYQGMMRQYRYTGWTLAHLGPYFGNPALGVAAPSLLNDADGTATLFFGDPSVGVFNGASATFTSSASTVNGDGFSIALIGSGFSGTAVYGSVIGNSQPDVVFSSVTEGGNAARIYILDGPEAISGGDIVTRADVIYPLPTDWLGAAQTNSLIRDLDGDGYSDIGVGEYNPDQDYPGRVLVLW